MKKLNKFCAILFAMLGVSTLSAQTEIISNGTSLNLQYNFGSPSSHTIPELWTSDARQGFNFSQTTELSNGVYALSFQMMYRASLTAGTETNCVLYAETSGEVYNTPIKNFADEANVAENLTGVTTAMNNGLYLNTIPYFVVTDGRATVGARSLGALTYCTNGYWTIWNPASFKLVSVIDEETLTTALEDVKAEAKAILDAAADSDAKTTLQAAYDAATATSDGIVTLKKAVKAYLPNTGTADNPVDVSSLILSADFSQKAFIVATKNNNSGVSAAELQPVGWTCTDNGSGQYNFFNVVSNDATYDGQSGFAYNGKTTGQTLYMRHAWGTATLVAKQTITLPNGRYKISIPAKKTGNTATVKYTFAGETETHDVTTEWAVYEKIFTVNDDNNELTIELTYNHPDGGGQRAFFDGVTLLCYGDPIAALLTEISAKKSELEAYNGTIPTAFYNSFSEHLAAAGSANNTQSESDLQEIFNNLNADITASSNAVAPYASLQTLITLCTEYTDSKNSNANSADVLTTFQTAINTATTDGNAATTVDAINTVHNTLETARQTYAKNAVPVYPYPFDMTFLLPNTTFDSNTDGWTKTGGANWMSAGKNVECYNTTFEFSMEYEGLNSGSWEIQVDAFYRYGGYNDAEAAHNGGTEQLLATLYANNNTVAVKSIMEGANKAGSVGATTTAGVRVPNAPAHCDAYFATGCYTNSIATVIADGNLKVGIKKEITQGSDWTIFDNFKLFYKGIDVTDLQNALSDLKTTADAIKGEKMGTAELAALTNALTNADTENTVAGELEDMISTLQSAYDAAVASIDFYATILPYITKAEGIDVSIATDYRTQYDAGTIEDDAVTVFQNLEVATYNYVTENFEYPVALSDTWNSTGTNTSAADFTGEHWSNDNARKYKNQYDGWGDPKQGYPANSWSIDFDQEVTLPAGKYVFKVAGRKSVDTALELVVTQGETKLGTVNDFPSGNTGLGINKAGATSFDANDATGFAKDGAGYGWQWRYVMFELDEEAAVKVAVHAETSKIYNWVSFGDYTLQMTEETYLAANMGGLDAPTAAANALVDTKPMGEAENTALKDALAMTVTTGADLRAKITALETAVANANTWRSTYNTEKGKLVAALERFETDYNDAENGALDHMAKSRWETVIAKAQAAAVAKDDLTSHEGLTTATTELVAALDAATVSVNEYAALDEAIKSANALLAAPNWGDEPFQRPEIAKAGLDTADEQAAYNAAEADGEGVTSLTEALDAAVETANNVTLNAPAEGDVFYITVATDGHGKLGNYVVASLGATGDNNKTGYGFNASVDNTYNPFTKVYAFEQVEGNNYRISVTVNAETVYLTYGSLNESAADWATQQIQGTTNKENAGTFKIEASMTKAGVVKFFNTENNNYLDCQDGGSVYTDTNIASEDFALTLVDELQASVDVNISEEVKLSTCVLMFDAQLPAELEAYVGVSIENDCLILQKVEGTLPAYTPCLLYAEGGFTGTLEGTVEKGSYTATTVIGDFLCGAIDKTVITEGYVMQNQADYGVGFFNVASEKTIPVGKCWLSKETLDATPAAVGMRFINGGATKLNPVLMDKAVLDGSIYTIDGKRVNSMERGQIYIISGQKVMIK